MCLEYFPWLYPASSGFVAMIMMLLAVGFCVVKVYVNFPHSYLLVYCAMDDNVTLFISFNSFFVRTMLQPYLYILY